MKNFKRLVAATIAATMALALSVSTFAEVEVTSEDNITYASAAATYAPTITAKDGTQMTVVIFDATKELADLTGEDLLYINQDEEGVLSLTSMGTKIDLLEANEDGSAKYAGEYVIRVGYYDADGNWQVAEGNFTVATKQGATGTPYVVGDVDGDAEITIADVTTLIDKVLNKITYFTTSSDVVLPKLVGDTDNDTEITIADVTTAIDKVLNKITGFVNPTYVLPANTTPESTY